MTDANGDVPLQKKSLFETAGKDSNIYIPLEFDFKEDVTVYHAFEWGEAIAGLGGSSQILSYISKIIQPFVLLVFMTVLA